jgi:hypothetical protein
MTRDSVKGLLIAIGIGLGVLFFWALSDPHVNIPVMSNLACSVKGGTWSNGNILQPQGCYDNATP